MQRAGLVANVQVVRLSSSVIRRGPTQRSWLGRWARWAMVDLHAAVAGKGCNYLQGSGLLSIYKAVTAAVGTGCSHLAWARCQGAAGALSVLTETGGDTSCLTMASCPSGASAHKLCREVLGKASSCHDQAKPRQAARLNCCKGSRLGRATTWTQGRVGHTSAAAALATIAERRTQREAQSGAEGG